MSRIEVAAELCKSCELCISVCPKDCIEHAGALNRYGVFPVRMRKDAACIGCSQCAIICPDTAIEVFRTVVEESKKEEARQ
jgi:2-oxoglutarate ferredoxin oxidoreductase subunit delta